MQTLGDKTIYSIGAYTAYIAPNSSMTPPAYQESASITAAFPDGTGFIWAWPANTVGIVSWLAVDFGNYDYTTPQTPITPKMISTVSALTVSFDMTLTGDLTGFDVVIDLFTTSKINDETTQQHEIEILLHSPAYSQAYVSSLTSIGTFTDANGVVWKCVVNKTLTPHDILFMPSDCRDILSGSVDVHAMLAWLVGLRWLSGAEYFNGLAIGVEVQQGLGAATLNSFSVGYN